MKTSLNPQSIEVGSITKEMLSEQVVTSLDTIATLEQELTELSGKKEVRFDFSTGLTTQYTNRYVEYNFELGKKYRIVVKTTDSTTTTYFSVRDVAGQTVGGMNLILKGAGERYTDFECVADGARLYMSYMEDGVAIVYDVTIINLSDNNIISLNSKTVELGNELSEVNKEFENLFIRGDIGITTLFTTPSSGTYKGVNVFRNYNEGDSIRIEVTTESTDKYYIRLYNDDTLVQTLIFGHVGSGVFNGIAVGTINRIRFVVESVSSSYDYIIRVLPNDISTILPLLDDVSNIVENYLLPVPDYANEQKERIMNILRSLSGHEVIVLGFNTDQHMTKAINPSVQYYPQVRGLNALRDMAETFPFDMIVLGGDEVSYDSTTILACMTDTNDCIKAVDSFACPIYAMAGNHDAGQNYNYVNADGYMEFNAKTKRNVVRREIEGYGNRSTNFYRDDVVHKIRYIFLDVWSRNQTEYSNILDEALADTKLLNSDWRIILFSHNVVKSGLSINTENPIEDSHPDVWTKINTFIQSGGSILACFNGHCHKDVQDVYQDIPFIAISSACNTKNISFDGMIYPRTPNTTTETAFDVIVIDKTDNILYMLRYGAGMDRVFNITKGNVSMLLIEVSGSVIGASVGDVVKVSHNNTVYSHTLAEDMTFRFPYICPSLGDWEIVVESNGINIYDGKISPTITDTVITKDISIS